MSTQVQCHFCQHAFSLDSEIGRSLPRVTSDCRPVAQAAPLAVCPSCCLTQTVVNDEWRSAAEDTYEVYQIYSAADGSEQKVATEVGLCGRSQVLVGQWSDFGDLPSSGRMIDVGCGNGAFLRAFAEKFPAWELNGAETSERYLSTLQQIPNFRSFYGGDPNALTGSYQAMSLVHVLEHLEDPVSYLQALRKRAASDAQLFVEVPAWQANPFALMITDHASHFTVDTLKMVVGAGGWMPLSVSEKWVPKELSLIAGNSSTVPDAVSLNLAAEQSALCNAIDWLSATMTRAREIAAGSRNFGLFGTAIAATWLYQGMPDAVKFFVDEDPQRVGRTHLGLPILSPHDVPEGADVFVGVSPLLSGSIATRLASPLRRYHQVAA